MQGNNFQYYDRFQKFSQTTERFQYYISSAFSTDQLKDLQNYQQLLNNEIEERENADSAERKYTKQQWMQRIREKIGAIWDGESKNETGGRGSKKRKTKKKKTVKKPNLPNQQTQQEIQKEMNDISNTVNKVFDQNNVQNQHSISQQNASATMDDPTVIYNQQNPFDVSNYVSAHH